MALSQSNGTTFAAGTVVCTNCRAASKKVAFSSKTGVITSLLHWVSSRIASAARIAGFIFIIFSITVYTNTAINVLPDKNKAIFHILYPGKPCFLAGKSWFLKKKGIVVEHEWISRCVFAKGEEKFT
jgi:hypothetical protein